MRIALKKPKDVPGKSWPAVSTSSKRRRAKMVEGLLKDRFSSDFS